MSVRRYFVVRVTEGDRRAFWLFFCIGACVDRRLGRGCSVRNDGG